MSFSAAGDAAASVAVDDDCVAAHLPFWQKTIAEFAAAEPHMRDQLADALRFVSGGISERFDTPPPPAVFANTPAVAREAKFVRERISYYSRLGALRVVPASQECTHIQPLHVICKAGKKHRLVLDLSRNLNGSIPHRPIAYEDVRHALAGSSPGCYFAKTDFSDCFLRFSVRKSFAKFLRFAFEGNVYEFIRMPFGLSSAPYFCELLLSVVSWKLRSMGIRHTRYIDDILFYGDSEAEVEHNLAVALELFKLFGLPVGAAKTVHACRRIPFLGVSLDSVNETVELTQERRAEIVALIRKFLSLRSAKLRQVESLVGKLSFAAIVLPGARPFMRSIIDAIGGHDRSAVVRLSAAFKVDLRTWLRSLDRWNGSRRWTLSNRCFDFTSDASLEGFAYYPSALPSEHGLPEHLAEGVAFAGSWSSELDCIRSHEHIAYLEALAALHALSLYAPFLSRSLVTLWIDNSACVHIVNRQSTSSPKLLAVLRSMYSLATHYGFELRASHIPGSDNVIADALSRPRSQLVAHAHYRESMLVFDVCSCQAGLSLIDCSLATRSWRRPPVYSEACICGSTRGARTPRSSASL